MAQVFPVPQVAGLALALSVPAVTYRVLVLPVALAPALATPVLLEGRTFACRRRLTEACAPTA